MDQAQQLRNIIKKQELEPPHTDARVITVTSGKGGVGKTSVSVNLAITLSKMGKKVILLDADFGLANIEIILGVRPRYNLADLMFKGKEMKDIITYGPENIGFISGGSGINEMANLTKDQVSHLIEKMCELDRIADVIIVDTGAGIGDAVLEFVAASSEVLLVATPEPTSITDAYALLKSLNRCSSYRPGKTTVKMIANQVREDKDAAELFGKIGVVVNKFLNIEVEFLGEIPYDVNIPKAIMMQTPVTLAFPTTDAARAIVSLVNKLENIEQPKERRGIVQMFASVIKMKLHR